MLAQSNSFNENYAAKIVNVNNFRPHSNPEINALKIARVDGYDIIVSIDTEPGMFLYFPIGCAIDKEFLKVNNLFKNPNCNSNPDVKPGFFEENGRLKTLILRGEKSYGFLCPLSFLDSYVSGHIINNSDVGIDFDTICGKQICRKYIIQQTQKLPGTGNRSKKVNKNQSIHLVEDQFRFHVSTTLLRKVPQAITPDSLISISSKWHGTSSISANLLQEIPDKEGFIFKWGRRLFTNKPEPFHTEYRDVCSSRTVIKDPLNNPNVGIGWYGVDIWNIAHQIIKPHLKKGLSVYYEIIGYLPSGAYIQKNYDYGYLPPKDGEDFTYDKHYGIRIYRITYTNVAGQVFEFSARQVQQWCASKELKAVQQFYYGYAKDLYPDLDVTDLNWQNNFIDVLAQDKRFYMEMSSPDCNNKVPHEGIVIRNETLGIEVYKLKCFKFLKMEDTSMDNSEFDLESDN